MSKTSTKGILLGPLDILPHAPLHLLDSRLLQLRFRFFELTFQGMHCDCSGSFRFPKSFYEVSFLLLVVLECFQALL